MHRYNLFETNYSCDPHKWDFSHLQCNEKVIMFVCTGLFYMKRKGEREKKLH